MCWCLIINHRIKIDPSKRSEIMVIGVRCQHYYLRNNRNNGNIPLRSACPPIPLMVEELKYLLKLMEFSSKWKFPRYLVEPFFLISGVQWKVNALLDLSLRMNFCKESLRSRQILEDRSYMDNFHLFTSVVKVKWGKLKFFCSKMFC